MLIPVQEINKFLYINIAHIGDIVLSLPVARALKAAYPAAQLDMLVSFPQGEAAYYNPYVDNVLFYNIRSWQQDKSRLLGIITMLQQENYDLAIASCYGTVDPMMAFLSRARYRAGFAVNGGEKYLNYVVPNNPVYVHEVERQLQVIDMLGIKADNTAIEFAIRPDDIADLSDKVPSAMHSKRLKVIICPISDRPQKMWPLANHIHVLKAMAQQAQCYLIGSNRQAAFLNEINEGAGSVAEVLAGSLTLGELGALIQAADLLITVDTGPMHIAQAFDTPVICLFGPTDPKRWGPRRPQDIIIRASVPCSPCWDIDDERHKRCRENRCMTEIRPETVIAAAANLLKNK
ncbi:MAG: glycosyltransferase family 9 protein [Veillonellaceae bacterium]|jgi:ADP-heptose:LPS heptosyltransferase|nr:glycosyltransferase family 9 protein [Veillonellaceae bacterium]